MDSSLKDEISKYLQLCNVDNGGGKNISLLMSGLQLPDGSEMFARGFASGLVFGKCIQMISHFHGGDTIPVDDMEELRTMIQDFMKKI